MEKNNLVNKGVTASTSKESNVNKAGVKTASAAQSSHNSKKPSRKNEPVIILDENTNFYITEAYKTIRSNIMFTLAKEDAPCKKILVSSAEQGEGKSTVSINLAITFAQTGERVLLVEGDMRRPVFAKRLNIANKIGLSTYLSGQCTLSEAIAKNTEYGFDYIPSGRIPPNPSELIISDKMTDLMNSLDDMYDYVIIDSPPITVVSETAGLARLSSGVILVVRSDITTHPLIERAMSALEFADAKLLGFVLNGENINNVLKKRGYKYNYYKKRGYGRYGYYGYGSGYGYGYGYGTGSHHNAYPQNAPVAEVKTKERFEK